MRRYSHSPASADDQVFHDGTSKALTSLRRAIGGCDRVAGEDLASTQIKRKKRSRLEQAIRSIEAAQRMGFYEEERHEFPVLTKQTLKRALKETDDVGKIASYFGMSEGAIHRLLRMFHLNVDAVDDSPPQRQRRKTSSASGPSQPRPSKMAPETDPSRPVPRGGQTVNE